MRFDPGSFRDPAGRVFYHEGRVYRSITTGSRPLLPPSDIAGFWPATVVEHPTEMAQAVTQPTLPLVSYPYEWSFEMLRDAALQTLNLQLRLLERGLSLKDATGFNITFVGSEATLFDCYSIESFPNGGLWPAFGQFCRAFLNPLLIWSHQSIDPRPWLQTGLGELTHETTLKLLGRLSLLKKGVFKNVYLPFMLESMVSKSKSRSAQSVQTLQVPIEQTQKIITKTRDLVSQLNNPRGSGVWTHYTDTCTYKDSDTQTKEKFVLNALTKLAPRRVIDVGCNTGRYSLLAATVAKQVFSCDLDAACIDSLYIRCKRDSALAQKVFPLVVDLTRPAPALGWRLAERKDAFQRLRSDAFLSLALIHHLRISGGIPVSEILEALNMIAPAGVLEWVSPEDPMVKELNAFRRLDLHDLEWNSFRQLVEQRFQLVEQTDVNQGLRKLLFLVPKEIH